MQPLGQQLANYVCASCKTNSQRALHVSFDLLLFLILTFEDAKL